MIPIFILLIIGLVLCSLIYTYQEKLIFFPEKLEKDYAFEFDQHFEELNIKMEDGISLHGLLFQVDSTKGLIFYLHGNAGSLSSWGGVAKTYNNLNYDVFILDYRGFGKSEGVISGKKQLFADVQTVYNELKLRYNEAQIIILGYSIGTGPAAKLAATNHPKLLILQAPYYSLADLVNHYFPFMPGFLLKYPMNNYQYIENCEMPVIIFHGDSDEVIPYGSSIKLKDHFKDKDELILLNGQEHNGMTFNDQYRFELRKILKNDR